MKYSYSAVALVLAVAQAQFPNVPSCAVTCFATALSSDGCEDIADIACHCSQPDLLSQITPCVEGACTAEEAESVAGIVGQACTAAGTESGAADGQDGDATMADAAEMTATETVVAGETGEPAEETETETEVAVETETDVAVVDGAEPTETETETEVVDGAEPTETETETEVVDGAEPTETETETEVVDGAEPTETDVDVEVETETEVDGVDGPEPTETEIEVDGVDGPEPTETEIEVDGVDGPEPTETEIEVDGVDGPEPTETETETETVETDVVEPTDAAGDGSSPDVEPFEGVGSHLGAGSITTVAAAVFAAVYALC